MDTETIAINQLLGYKNLIARIKVLSNYPVGAGITVSRLNQDDQLQELHRRLRGMPSYMYLGKYEQQLEATAHAYLTRYPSGIKSQLAAIPRAGADADDVKLLQELRGKIQKVISARGWEMDDLDTVLERVSELQDLQVKVQRIDNVFEAMQDYQPDYVKVLKLTYVEGLSVSSAAREIGIAERTFRRWKTKAECEFTMLSV